MTPETKRRAVEALELAMLDFENLSAEQMLDAALAAIAAEAWQTIESAPKDGTDALFLIRGTEIQMVAAFDSSAKDQMFPWITEDGPNRHRDGFSHWRPLPPPPKVTK